MYNMNKLILIILFSITASASWAGESFIPLEKGKRMPSDDLIYQNDVLSSRQALDLSNFRNVDLSMLSPKNNEIWSDSESAINDQEVIELEATDILDFSGALTSNSGLYRFNAISEKNSKIYTIHLDKTLHTLLLRKNLLRKLGYKIPAIKYLKNLTVQFGSIEEREQFLKKDIPENTLGAPERWVKNVNNLTIELQDVAVTEPSETDFYNVAMGLPTQTINSRTLRSLIIPYSLVDLYESVNKFNWIDGKVDNGAIVLSHFTGNEFGTSIEDAQWGLRRVNKLSREDIKQIVSEAFFPDEVGAVLVEKIISRINSLNRLFSEQVQMEFNQKISIGESVRNGTVIEKDYPGYAARFSYGDAETPFEQIRYYLYSKIQSTVIDNLVSKFNTYLDAYDLNKLRTKFFKEQFQKGLDHFIKTGEIVPLSVSSWTTPVANAQLIFSRDIVLGNYLGTDNLVQLADTFGASVNLGYYVGIENLGNDLSSGINASTSFVRTFSHVKPITNLKAALKQPYKNMFINLLKRSLRDRYFSLSELKNSTIKDDEKNKQIQNLLKEIDQYLAVGESLIMTDRIMPTLDMKLNLNNGLVSAGIGASGGFVTIKRIQLYKKSPKVLQIYDDSGFVKDINLSFQANEYISLLKISGKFDRGNYSMKSYMVNLSGDLSENPNLYINSLGVYNVLKDKNFEVLSTVVNPVKMEATFRDRSYKASLLFWKAKLIKGKTYYALKAKDGVNGNYFSFNKDSTHGINSEALTKQMVNYYLASQGDGGISLNTGDDVNPGDTFFGRSKTQNISFEAEVSPDKKFINKFISLTDSKQGWALGATKLKQMMDSVNKKFQVTLFDTVQIDFQKLRLYKVGYHINLYDRGIEHLNAIKISDIKTIEDRYRKERGCSNAFDSSDNYNSIYCGDLSVLKRKVRKCKKSKNEEEVASCDVELVDEMLSDLEFKDFKNLIGENNLYVYGTIDGFRQGSEVLNDTIYSNTLGKIGSKEWNGPLDVVRNLLGLSDGEFSGSWLRESTWN